MPSFARQARTHTVRSRSDATTYLTRDSNETLRNVMNKPEVVRGGKNAKSANPANVKLLTPKKKAATIKPPGKSKKGCSKCAKKQQTGSAPSKAGKAGTKPTKHIRIR